MAVYIHLVSLFRSVYYNFCIYDFPILVPSRSKFGTQSIFDKDDNQYTRLGNNMQQYTPMYPIYNFGNAMAQN